MGSFAYSLGHYGFILGRWVDWGASMGRRVHLGSLSSLWCALAIVWFIPGFWVHWGESWVWLGSFGVAGFIVVCPGGRRDHPGSLSELGVYRGGRRVHPGSMRSLACAQGVVGFFSGLWVLWGAPWVSSGSSTNIGVRTGGRRVHPW